MRLFDPLRNCLIPRNFFSSPEPPPEPEPVEPIEIPEVEPVELPPPPEPIEIPEPEEPTFREKYEMTPEIPMRRFESRAKELQGQVDYMKAAGGYTDADIYNRQMQQDKYEAGGARWRKETEIVNPAALHIDDIIPPPASTGSTEAQEKADEERRKQAGRQGTSKSIIAGEQTTPYASSATGSGSLLG